jgi:dTDP-4-amino-4,6-dideoxygalactose transaminase
MSYYRRKYGYDQSRFRGAERISDDTFALPVAPHVSDEDVTYIGETLGRLAGVRV